MSVDLNTFRTGFPQWADCPDDMLTFWNDLAGTIICPPKRAGAFGEKIPLLMLAHLLTINKVFCNPSETVVDGTTVETTDNTSVELAAGDTYCNMPDDRFLDELLAGGARLSSVGLEGITASFDNAGINSLVAAVGKSAFSAWLATSQYGLMIAALLPRLYAGPTMAIGPSVGMPHYADDVLPHLRLPGHG